MFWSVTAALFGVQIVRLDRTMEQIVFPVPNICEFLTQESKLRVYYTTERDEQGSKINDFFLRSEDLFNEMNWQKKLRGTQEATGNTNTVPCASFSSTLYELVPGLRSFFLHPSRPQAPFWHIHCIQVMFYILAWGISKKWAQSFPPSHSSRITPNVSSTYNIITKTHIPIKNIKASTTTAFMGFFKCFISRQNLTAILYPQTGLTHSFNFELC